MRFCVGRIALIAVAVALFGCGRNPRAPENAIPVVYQIGWWDHQDNVNVTGLEPSVIDSHLNVFNNDALVVVRIEGSMRIPEGHRQPFVSAVHVTERFTPESTDAKRVAELIFTPVISVREDDKYQGEPIAFALPVEYTLHSFAWGPNRFVLRAGNIQRELVLQHPK